LTAGEARRKRRRHAGGRYQVAWKGVQRINLERATPIFFA
jgi:hypothetical protein